MLIRQAPRSEALWLSEALAQTAETWIGDSLQQRGDLVRARLYLEPMYQRARAYLQNTGPVSLLVSAGHGSLAERGAGWLFLRYLQGHQRGGAADLLRALTRTTRTGIENVEASTGLPWSTAFSDWSVATFMDGLLQQSSGALQYPDFDLRTALVEAGGAYPLSPSMLPEEFERTGSRLSASSEYFLLPAFNPVAIRLADRSGGAPPPEARFILRVVRVL
jgi:hypothetical protein